ncbi:MAG: sn-glycerol-3-phosphate import ATP-binding protein UgpC [Verrucomicrobia subdivision 3 bacterium]|nr:sn-glycerol-3-phosphate import ATP-binding protein UgpC [Limisphaerales bacterium]MCS1414575.1 sn-glycerol-3-phosphate import ATP-binding protein UgpC [Limisphaerales bacterium]
MVSLEFRCFVRLIVGEAMVEIQVQGVTKRYRNERRQMMQAVDAVDLTVARGEMLMVVGPSGSGKTSLLRLIAGLEEPNEGRVLFDGVPVLNIRPAKRGVFMLFQDALLYPNLTVGENLAVPLTIRRTSPGTIRERVEAVARRFRVDERLDSLPEQLSRGERQRVALGRAILSESSVLLLDEPLVNLEPEIRFRLRIEIASLREEVGSTVVYVTHDPFEAFTLGDRVAVLNHGRLQQVDRPDEVYRKPANQFVAGFVGFPPMNRILGEVRSTHEGFCFVSAAETGGCGGIRLNLPNDLWSSPPQMVVMGVRPEDVSIELAAKENGSMGMEATVSRIERYGADAYWHLNVAGVSLIAQSRSQELASRGAQVWLTFDKSQALWFDPRTSERLA